MKQREQGRSLQPEFQLVYKRSKHRKKHVLSCASNLEVLEEKNLCNRLKGTEAHLKKQDLVLSPKKNWEVANEELGHNYLQTTEIVLAKKTKKRKRTKKKHAMPSMNGLEALEVTKPSSMSECVDIKLKKDTYAVYSRKNLDADMEKTRESSSQMTKNVTMEKKRKEHGVSSETSSILELPKNRNLGIGSEIIETHFETDAVNKKKRLEDGSISSLCQTNIKFLVDEHLNSKFETLEMDSTNSKKKQDHSKQRCNNKQKEEETFSEFHVAKEKKSKISSTACTKGKRDSSLPNSSPCQTNFKLLVDEHLNTQLQTLEMDSMNNMKKQKDPSKKRNKNKQKEEEEFSELHVAEEEKTEISSTACMKGKRDSSKQKEKEEFSEFHVAKEEKSEISSIACTKGKIDSSLPNSSPCQTNIKFLVDEHLNTQLQALEMDSMSNTKKQKDRSKKRNKNKQKEDEEFSEFHVAEEEKTEISLTACMKGKRDSSKQKEEEEFSEFHVAKKEKSEISSIACTKGKRDSSFPNNSPCQTNIKFLVDEKLNTQLQTLEMDSMNNTKKQDCSKKRNKNKQKEEEEFGEFHVAEEEKTEISSTACMKGKRDSSKLKEEEEFSEFYVAKEEKSEISSTACTEGKRDSSLPNSSPCLTNIKFLVDEHLNTQIQTLEMDSMNTTKKQKDRSKKRNKNKQKEGEEFSEFHVAEEEKIEISSIACMKGKRDSSKQKEEEEFSEFHVAKEEKSEMSSIACTKGKRDSSLPNSSPCQINIKFLVDEHLNTQVQTLEMDSMNHMKKQMDHSKKRNQNKQKEEEKFSEFHVAKEEKTEISTACMKGKRDSSKQKAEEEFSEFHVAKEEKSEISSIACMKGKRDSSLPNSREVCEDLGSTLVPISKKVKTLEEMCMPLEGPIIKYTKRRLLVLDVNGLLADVGWVRFPGRGEHMKLGGGKTVFKRPFSDEFLKFCFEKFDVGIWSSATMRNVQAVVNFLLQDMKSKILFCWDRSKCTMTTFNTIENKHKPLVLKELKKIWDKDEPDLPWERGDYAPSNTLLLDDSPYKALTNPPHTAIFPYPYRFEEENDNALGPGGDLRVYLEGVAMADDVQQYVEKHPFGQPAITASHPDWDFYFNISSQYQKTDLSTV